MKQIKNCLHVLMFPLIMAILFISVNECKKLLPKRKKLPYRYSHLPAQRNIKSNICHGIKQSDYNRMHKWNYVQYETATKCLEDGLRMALR